MRKRKKDTLSRMAIGTIGSTVVVANMPNPTGSAAITNIKGKAAEGYGKIGATFPTQGKLIGTGMVLKGIGKLKKKSKRLI